MFIFRLLRLKIHNNVDIVIVDIFIFVFPFLCSRHYEVNSQFSLIVENQLEMESRNKNAIIRLISIPRCKSVSITRLPSFKSTSV